MKIPRRALLKTYYRDSLESQKEITISTGAWRHLLACKSPYEHDDLPTIGSNQEIIPLCGTPKQEEIASP